MEPNSGQSGTLVSDTSHGNENAFPPFRTETFVDQILWLAITFGCLFYAVKHYIVPRISGILQQRKEILQADLAKAAELKEQAEESARLYDEALTKAKQDAADLAQKLHEDVYGRIQLQRQDLNKHIEAELKRADERIDKTRVKALSNVNEIAYTVAEDIVKQLSGKAPDHSELELARNLKS